jgi:hypothetical protein
MNSRRLIPQMEGGTVGPCLVRCMTAEVKPVGFDQLVFGDGLVDWLAIPGSDDPSRNVLHEVALLVAIDAELSEEFAIFFGEKQGQEGETSRSTIKMKIKHCEVDEKRKQTSSRLVHAQIA